MEVVYQDKISFPIQFILMMFIFLISAIVYSPTYVVPHNNATNVLLGIILIGFLFYFTFHLIKVSKFPLTICEDGLILSKADKRGDWTLEARKITWNDLKSVEIFSFFRSSSQTKLTLNNGDIYWRSLGNPNAFATSALPFIQKFRIKGNIQNYSR